MRALDRLDLTRRQQRQLLQPHDHILRVCRIGATHVIQCDVVESMGAKKTNRARVASGNNILQFPGRARACGIGRLKARRARKNYPGSLGQRW